MNTCCIVIVMNVSFLKLYWVYSMLMPRDGAGQDAYKDRRNLVMVLCILGLEGYHVYTGSTYQRTGQRATDASVVEKNIYVNMSDPRGKLTVNQVQGVGANAISTNCMLTYSEMERTQHI